MAWGLEGSGQFLAGDRAPGQEPLAVGGQRANACLHGVGDQQRSVVDEQGGNLLENTRPAWMPRESVV